MKERLQKVISQAGIASRRHAEELIVAGRVKVNGKVVVELGTKVETLRDVVAVDNQVLAAEKKFYVLLNKPRGCVTTLSDPEKRKTVASFVADIPARLYPIGRLDYNTEGLLLLTNDGQFTHSLTHPSREIGKTYVAEVLGRPSEEKLDLLRLGVQLEDGVTAPAKVWLLDYDEAKGCAQLELVIHEGRNRQIRRMCETIGHPVNKLKRIKFAFLNLDGVRRGHYRHLLPDEIRELKKMATPKER